MTLYDERWINFLVTLRALGNETNEEVAMKLMAVEGSYKVKILFGNKADKLDRDCKECAHWQLCIFNDGLAEIWFNSFAKPFNPNHLAIICNEYLEKKKA